VRAFRRLYGDQPLHLAVLLGCFAVAAYAATKVAVGPSAVRIAVWFVAAAVAHDLVLFPLYALMDRSAHLLVHRSERREVARHSHDMTVNFLRVPALLSGLLFLVFAPGILRRSEGAYGRASGLDQSPYLGRWLLLTAALFLGSAVLYAVRAGRTARRRGDAAGATAGVQAGVQAGGQAGGQAAAPGPSR